MNPDPRRRVLMLFETHWDRKQLEACQDRWSSEFVVEFPEPSDPECEAVFDVLGFIERAVHGELGSIGGVTSASDYPGAVVAAAIAARLGLPGARAERVLETSHKWYSRLAQRDVAADAVPRFALIDPAKHRSVSIGLPCFVKPVKGSFSVLARRIASEAELAAFLESREVEEFRGVYMRIFNQLLRNLTRFEVDGGHFIAEEIAVGQLVTLEGFVCDNEVQLLGIVDSVVQPGTGSFLRFDYPTALPALVQERMTQLARRLVKRLGLDRTLFNIEMMWDPESERIAIIEINPRMCGQFADLYQKVDGTNGYEVALALCTGARPKLPRREGRHASASSYPLRVFERSRVVRAPTPTKIRRLETKYGALIWTECKKGDVLGDFASGEDGYSRRYAVLNVGGADRADVELRAQAIQDGLGFELEAEPEGA
jgi:biotin carboxylase